MLDLASWVSIMIGRQRSQTVYVGITVCQTDHQRNWGKSQESSTEITADKKRLSRLTGGQFGVNLCPFLQVKHPSCCLALCPRESGQVTTVSLGGGDHETSPVGQSSDVLSSGFVSLSLSLLWKLCWVEKLTLITHNALHVFVYC